MTNIVMLVACMLAGIVLRASHRAPENASAAINAFIIHIALPALILVQIHGTRLTPGLLLPVSMPWLMFGLSVTLFALLGRTLGFAPATTGALIMTAGLANTSFIGLPMIETFYGRQDLATGILIDQLGSYLVLSTLGITVACLFSSSSASIGAVARRILTFPPLIALVLALALDPVPFPDWVAGTLHRLADTLAPLALVSVGMQLRLDAVRGIRLPLGLGLAFKLLVAPLLVVLFYSGLLAWHGETARVTVFEAAMGPMIGGAIVAVEHGLSPQVVTLMVGVGIALSFLTLPIWYLGLATL